jgi:nitrilase
MSESSFLVAAIQTVSGPRVEDNLATAGALIREAAASGARLVALPEYFAIMGLRDTDKVDVAETPGRGPIQSFLAAAARELGIWLVGGSIPLRSPVAGKVYNSCLLLSPAGELAARYDKIHLFGLDLAGQSFSESRTITPGDTVCTVPTPLARIGLSICYDVRFPELYRSMGPVDLIAVPSAFTDVTGRAHWETLLRARAIENQAYVIAPAQGGVHPSGRRTHGCSMIVDPWGAILAQRDTGPGFVLAELKLSEVARVRQSLPALGHRRLLGPGAGA